MKLLSILFTLFTLFALALASCDCDDADRECVTQCVLDTEDCIIGCGDDTQCYELCIANKWPHANDFSEEEIFAGASDPSTFGAAGAPAQSNPGFDYPSAHYPSSSHYDSPITTTASATASGTANPSNSSAALSQRSSAKAFVSLLAAFGAAMWLSTTH